MTHRKIGVIVICDAMPLAFPIFRNLASFRGLQCLKRSFVGSSRLFPGDFGLFKGKTAIFIWTLFARDGYTSPVFPAEGAQVRFSCLANL
jgi:hypothetical protein